MDGLTEREFELFTLGSLDGRREMMRMLAWTQSNLINVQIPKGKRKLQADQLMPKRPKRHVDDDFVEPTDPAEAPPPDPAPVLDDPDLDPAARVRALGARVREKQHAQERIVFWSGPEGRKLRRILDE